MYPNLGSGTTQPSAPPPPPSSSSSSTSTTSTLTNTGGSIPVGFSSLMSQPSNQSTPYPGGQASQTPYPGTQSLQTPYPSGQASQPPYPTGPPSSSSSSSQAPYNNPYASNNPPPAQPPPNAGNYSPYSLPQTGQPPPPRPASQGANAGGYQNPYQQPQGNPYQQPQGNPYQQQGNPYQQQGNPSAGYPPGQQPPPPSSSSGYQNPYPPSNPYQSGNPYGPPQGNPGYQNPYPPQQGGYPPPPPSQQQQPPSYQNPYSSNPQQPPGGYGGGYPPYNQPQQQQQLYQNPYPYQPQAGGYNNPNTYGGAPAINERLRAIAGRYEIGDQLAQRLNILQQFEIVVVCDDSGSMNTPVAGTNGTRWDELRSIVQIIVELGAVFDSNGVDVHFLNRHPMLNVTDTRQVIESFNQRPGGLTPLTATLRRIFQSAAGKPGGDKRLLVFVATDGEPTDPNGTVDIRSLENLMRNERNPNTTYVTFLACTDDDSSVAYLSQWDKAMMNVDVVDDYKTEREEIRRTRGHNYPFSFGDYVAKALLGAVDPQMDSLDESSGYNNNNNNNYRRF